MSESQKWQEQLIALLYGELNSTEERELRLRLETDADLRREWDELQEGRNWLGALETDVEVPSFVFLTGPGEERSRQMVAAPPAALQADPAPAPARAAARGWWHWASPVWGAVAAVVLIGVLGLSGFRVQAIDGGLAFTFGDKAPAEPAQTLADTGTATHSPDLRGTNPGGVQTTPVSGHVDGDADEVGQDDLLYMVGAMIEERDRRRDQELAGILQAMYQDVGARQDRDYQDLKDRIRAMNVGMMLDRRGYENRFNNLEGEGVQSLDIPPGQPVNGPKEN